MLSVAEIVVGREDITSVIRLQDNYLLIVADGAGGIGGGFEAAAALVSLAKNQLLPKLNNITSHILFDFLNFADIEILRY